MFMVRKFAYGFVVFTAMSAISAFAAGTLPDGYTEVEYIKGPGNGRIETHYTPNPQTDKIEVVVAWPSTPTQNQAIWCARGTDAQDRTYTLFLLNSGGYKFRFDYNATLGNYLTEAIVAGTRYTNTVDRNVISWSGGDGQTHAAVETFTESGGPMVLFASYTTSGNSLTGWNNYGQYRLYSVKVWRSGELIHYFVPCKNSDGKGTLVDICDNPTWFTVSTFTFEPGDEGHFFDDSLFTVDDKLEVTGAPEEVGSPSPAYGKNAGYAAGETVAVSCGASPCTNEWGMIEYTCTGWKLYDSSGNELTNGTETAFTYTHPSPAKDRKLEWQWTSRKIAMFPTGYTECECIVVTNAGQYIDTLYKPNLTTDIEAHYEVPNLTTLNPLYWSRTGGNGTAFGFVLTANAGSARQVRVYRLSLDSGTANKTLANPIDTDLRLSTEYSGDGAVNTFTINGETQSFADKRDDSLDVSISLFRLKEKLGLNKDVPAVVGTKLFSFKILENGVVQKQFVPCLRESDSVAGLYDILDDDPTTAFYVNAGTGGSFGYEAKDTSAVALTVMGSPSQVGTPFPAYGTTNLTAGVALVAEMPQVAVTNCLTGEERELLGWTLAVTRSAVTETTYSTDLNKQICTFTPQEGDSVTLTWRWTPETYGARTLPAEYEATDYLEITQFDINRSSFVDTKYIPSLDDRIVVAFTPASPYYFPFCSRESNTLPASKPQLRIYVNNGNLSYMCGTGSSKDNLGTIPANLRTALAINGRGLYKDGEVVDARFGETDLSLEWPLVVGAGYGGYDSTSQRFSGVSNAMMGNIYAFKVWAEDGTPRMDLRPCTRKSDGTKGLYDVVRNVFCPLRRQAHLVTHGDPADIGTPTSGTYGDSWRVDDFTARYPNDGEQLSPGGEAKYELIGWTLRTVTVEGVETVVSNDASNVGVCNIPLYFGDTIYLTWHFNTRYLKPAGPNMPQRYSECEWMDFTNSYVVTDYVPHPDKIKMTTDFQLADQNLQGIFSARDGNNNRNYTTLVFPAEGQSSVGLQFAVNNSALDFWPTPPLGERLTLCSETNTVWVKGRTEKFNVGTFDGTFTEAPSALVYGAAHSALASFRYFSTMRFFGSKIWEKEGGEYQLVHDYRPCFDRLTGVSGLYDLVDGVFFPNGAGTHFECARKEFSGMIIIVR